jgi:hypothetical protein
MQRVALREALLRRTGTAPDTAFCTAPALQRTTPRRGGALRCVRGTRPGNPRSRTCECKPIHVLPSALILRPSCSRGALSRSDPSVDRAKAGRTGAPGRSMPGGNGGALGGAAPSLGRARCLAARGGYVNPASGVPIGALAPPTAPSPRLGARDRQTSDASRRENAKACLSFRGASEASEPGIHDHDRRLWIPGLRPRGRIPE